MNKIPAGKFKTHCLAIMDKVQATGEPVVITKRGTPVVKVIPVNSPKNEVFGFMRGKFKIVGDIVAPAIPLKQWKVMKH